MLSDTPDLIGYGAAVLTTAAFVPQAVKSWFSRDLSGISLAMYSLFTLGVGLWLVYGLAIGSWPVILANGITFVLAGTVLFLKIRHPHRK
ncbi:MAG: SemiSWEET transporter [Thiobacillaceae bacterium]|jgi:MtN3 and saliva related transmembrane protein|nr:SemiSWEET transporter [Thiobacillaceae bacterium]